MATKTEDAKREEWRPIAGFPGYHVSNFGRVKSFRKGDLIDVRILKPSRANKQRRALVTLYRNREPHYRHVSRLVCEAFSGPPPSPEHQAAHLNGNTQNDRADNLEWKTPVGNAKDRDVHGRTIRGSRHWANKLPPETVLTLRQVYALLQKRPPARRGFLSNVTTCLGVSRACVEDIVYGRKWKHLTW